MTKLFFKHHAAGAHPHIIGIKCGGTEERPDPPAGPVSDRGFLSCVRGAAKRAPRSNGANWRNCDPPLAADHVGVAAEDETKCADIKRYGGILVRHHIGGSRDMLRHSG